MPKAKPKPSAPATTAPRLIALYSDAPQSGKTTTAEYLNRCHWYAIRPFAGPLKRIAAAFAHELGIDSRYITTTKDNPIPDWNGLTGRHILQTLGTDWGRTHISSDVWLRAWQRSLGNAPRIVVDDIRFPNEAELVRNLGGVVWHVRRATGAAIEATNHTSEGALAGAAFDATLDNSTTKQALYDAIERLVR